MKIKCFRAIIALKKLVLVTKMLDFEKLSDCIEKIRLENGVVGMSVALTDRDKTVFLRDLVCVI